MALPIALQLYSVRDDMKEDFKGTLEKVKALGYDGVEFAGLFGHAPAEIRAWCRELGLNPISAHVPLQEMLEDLEGVLAQYKEIGVSYIAVPYLPEERRPGTDGFLPTIEDIRKVCRAVKALGMTALYHNHDFEFQKIDGEYGLDMLYRLIPADLLQTELDTCWVNIGGENPADYIRKYEGRCPVVHLKDFYREAVNADEPLYELIGIKSEKKKPAKRSFEFRPVGHGMQDFPAIIKAAEQSGASWVVVEQDQPSMDKKPMECAKMSIQYLKSIGL
ncbi:MAG: sugar phosphate isomerase/epimerase [Clostridiales bacterium]|nr:MAG: sugar phosphate isomerase/epimerase [Clostridiales bacterium]